MTDDLYGHGIPAKTEDVIGLRGCYDIHLMDTRGNILEKRHIDNVVVSAGRSLILSIIAGSTLNLTGSGFSWIEIGTSTTAPTTTDTVLNGTFQTSGGGTGRLNVSGGSFATAGLTSASPPSWQAQVTFATNQGNTTLGECGIFNVSGYNVATLLSHVTFATISKTTSNTLAISYTISN